MSKTPTVERVIRRRFAVAIAGLVLILASPALWALTLSNNYLQRSALVMWLAMIAGVLLGGLAVWQDRRRRTIVVAAINLSWVLLSIPGYLIFTRLPAPAEVSTEQVPAFTLSNHLGQPTTLENLLGGRGGTAGVLPRTLVNELPGGAPRARSDQR